MDVAPQVELLRSSYCYFSSFLFSGCHSAFISGYTLPILMCTFLLHLHVGRRAILLLFRTVVECMTASSCVINLTPLHRICVLSSCRLLSHYWSAVTSSIFLVATSWVRHTTVSIFFSCTTPFSGTNVVPSFLTNFAHCYIIVVFIFTLFTFNVAAIFAVLAMTAALFFPAILLHLVRQKK